MKLLINRILNKLGYSITKAPLVINGIKVEYNFLEKHSWIVKYNISTILDIGANKGQFAARFRILFPKAKIYSFEPIPEIFEHLCARFKLDENFKAFNLGLGNKSGKIDFFQNEFSDSSSAFPMKGLHKSNFPKTIHEKQIRIDVERLDDVMNDISFAQPLLIKIDVQGFEEMVILGGLKTLSKAEIVIVEVSFFELYENQVYFETIYNHMKSLFFSFKGNFEQLISPIDGCVLQADAIFVRDNV
ncbi:FkbM family methyltransferase [Algoriphagus machipongonensis]|uniref:Methyltransferase n=1 Tax=Algoriphagus machipongonensis TaxID=388413 RepID=A3HRH4_9BACT|nr:FkbM family methyltransferase [Algoriphagus machipongonensis]EAZ82442.1 methyltransferase [Algoriphagus machipongonensis]